MGSNGQMTPLQALVSPKCGEERAGSGVKGLAGPPRGTGRFTTATHCATQNVFTPGHCPRLRFPRTSHPDLLVMALFGRKKSTIGLDVGSGLIKVAVIDHSRGEPELARVVITPL